MDASFCSDVYISLCSSMDASFSSSMNASFCSDVYISLCSSMDSFFSSSMDAHFCSDVYISLCSSMDASFSSSMDAYNCSRKDASFCLSVFASPYQTNADLDESVPQRGTRMSNLVQARNERSAGIEKSSYTNSEVTRGVTRAFYAHRCMTIQRWTSLIDTIFNSSSWNSAMGFCT